MAIAQVVRRMTSEMIIQSILVDRFRNLNSLRISLV
jgi:hypothetical protein